MEQPSSTTTTTTAAPSISFGCELCGRIFGAADPGEYCPDCGGQVTYGEEGEPMHVYLTKEKLAHRLAIECRALALAEGSPAGAIMVAEGQGSWTLRAFADEAAAHDVAVEHRRDGQYTNVYDEAEVLMFISDPAEWQAPDPAGR